MNLYLKIFTQKKMAVLLLLGFSSGLPLALTFGTLQAMLKDAGLSFFEGVMKGSPIIGMFPDSLIAWH